MSYKVKIHRKFFVVSPVPSENIKNGLGIEYGSDTQFYTRFACGDIIKGQSRYMKPTYAQTVGRKIIRAFINEKNKN
jgi:hypothetical protein